MTSRPRIKAAKFRCQLTSVALVAVLAAATSGCKTTQSSAPDPALAMASANSDADWRKLANEWGERHRANPNDPAAAVNYAQALRGVGQRSQAAAVLEQASIQNPKNLQILGAYGRALADAGSYQQALDVLNRAHTPERPDWRILSVQGAVLDQVGRHDEAQRYYATALRIVPDEPSVLSNLALSYALSKDLVSRVRCKSLLSRAGRRQTPAGAEAAALPSVS
jgi:Flp pilus assembly protein TadD